VAYLCLRTAAMVREREQKRLLREVARAALASAASFPLGTAYYQHTYWEAQAARGRGRGDGPDRSAARGPVDARVFVSELRYALRLHALQSDLR
jgi:hypothetical protein